MALRFFFFFRTLKVNIIRVQQSSHSDMGQHQWHLATALLPFSFGAFALVLCLQRVVQPQRLPESMLCVTIYIKAAVENAEGFPLLFWRFQGRQRKTWSAGNSLAFLDRLM